MNPARTEQLNRHALRLAGFTVAYNVLEGIVAIAAGITAGLVSLIGFGFDSGIESATAILVGLRLAARLRHGERDEAKERRALKFVSVTFFVLAAYVVAIGIRDLVLREQPNPSPVGIGLLVASVVVMPILAAMKKRVGTTLGDSLVLADAAETRICVLLSISTLLGLVLFALTGAAWIDPVAGFVIAVFAINEGREAWHGELEEDDHHTRREHETSGQ
ncbi:cation diffusion facilitator family transporter [Lacisediminihabitans profunda]|uniref:Cation transporter n=1 Tax=Lacisediminihabitans profunda TaxID=2594790 RepID=A0A5C8ULJ8_9MICO|nr:cation transporter [Lacisediminihabitans profunda]TXN28333.1 cation transporter [Lacisediminihabitans profunda]